MEDGKISPLENYTYRNKKRTKGQLTREAIEYALEKGYIEIDDVLTPPEIVDKILDKILTEFQKETNLKANDNIYWEIYDEKNNIHIRPEKLEIWKDKDTMRKTLTTRIMNIMTSAQTLTLDNQSVMIKYVKYKGNPTGKLAGTKSIKNTDN